MKMRRTFLWLACPALLCNLASAQVLQTDAAHNTSTLREPHIALPATHEIELRLRARLTEARLSRGRSAHIALTVQADSDGPTPSRVTLVIPLASDAEAYGESRSCRLRNGVREMVLTAGLDEKNFQPFAAWDSSREFHLLLNKYLCRALAAPYRCNGREFTPVRDMARWRIGAVTTVELGSQAPARLTVSPVELADTGRRFDYAQCAAIAPSDGFCCVASRETQWHCGGKPTGAGWHQVSGTCFHRETGAACHE